MWLGGKIYWTTLVETSGKIQRANLDGSNIESLVTGLDYPRGLPLDVAGGKIYWTEDGRMIRRANLDGSNSESLVTGLDSPSGLGLDMSGGKIYWVGGWAGMIRRANLDGSNIESLVTGLADPRGLALDVVGRKEWRQYWNGQHAVGDKS